jgi:hypothetical protein
VEFGIRVAIKKGRGGLPANSIGIVQETRGESIRVNFEDTVDLSFLPPNVSPVMEMWIPASELEPINKATREPSQW